MMVEQVLSKGVIWSHVLVNLPRGRGVPRKAKEAQESASHHFNDPQCASAQRNVLENVILNEAEVILKVNLVKSYVMKIMIFHLS